jgi:hypothetical protein
VTTDAEITDTRIDRDAGRDVPEVIPPIDARPRDANRDDCPDADSTLVYVVAENNDLLSFNPATGAFRRIGTLACPASPGQNPFSMAVDRTGVAYVSFVAQPAGSASIFRVSTATAACAPTSFTPNQNGFSQFGMGFSSDQGGAAETLFVATDDNPSVGLGKIDTDTFALSKIAPFFPSLTQVELTGTGDGRLFAFYSDTVGGSRSFIGEIEKGTANVIAEDELGISQGRAWAFAYWGGDFYVFTAFGSGSRVTKFNTTTKAIATVANFTTSAIVGAGVSTCAPQK